MILAIFHGGKTPPPKGEAKKPREEEIEVLTPPHGMQPSVLPETCGDGTSWVATELFAVGNRPSTMRYCGKTHTTYNKTIL